MSIQFSFFLGIYIIVLIIISIIASFNIYHIIKFGKSTKGSHLLIALYLIGTLIILAITFFFLQNIDMNQSLDLFNNNSNNLLNF